MEIQRRAFLKKTGSAAFCACLGCTGVLKSAEIYMSSKVPGGYRIEGAKLIIDLSKYPQLKEVGGSVTIESPDKKVIVLHLSQEEYKAFENKCTHKGGQVSYSPKDGFMLCALHGSRFDTNGGVIKGPAKLPLPEFKTAVDKDELTVFLS